MQIDLCFISKNMTTFFSGDSIWYKMKIKQSQINDSMIINFIPFIERSQDPFNGKLTFILPGNEFLIIRFVISDLEGNEMKTYKEKVWYFKKAE